MTELTIAASPTLTKERISRLRARTTGTTLAVHANHAGGSPAASHVLDAMIEHLQREALDGPTEAGEAAAPRVEAARAAAARLVGAEPSEIAFVPGATAGWGMVFAALPHLRPGDRVLVGRSDWGGTLATLEAAAPCVGARVETIPSLEHGDVDTEALSAMMDDRVRLISLAWQPANGGLVNDATAVGRIARAAGVPYFIDAAQAFGGRPVNVNTLGCDVLVGSGRKALGGPRGIAVLYVRKCLIDRLSPAFLDVLSAPWCGDQPALRDDAQLSETAETPKALHLGLGAAIEATLELGPQAIAQRADALGDCLRDGLAALPNVTVRDLGRRRTRSGIVSFTIAGVPPLRLRTILATRGIRIGAHPKGLTPIDMTLRGLDSVARASVSHLNTAEEIERIVEEVALDATKSAC